MHQTDRRVKVVVLSSRGKQLRTRLLNDFHRPPAILSELSNTDLEALHRLSARLRPE
ncbi:hypothetical protein [Streptosporangium subroseum]|uniref:hypothetical protein n=1 Tax=Streptosporangium subroseum TaxID=106412 RepID=UPI0015C61B7D|nr:hypothetical protein [Streptosporangium subroseum]